MQNQKAGRSRKNFVWMRPWDWKVKTRSLFSIKYVCKRFKNGISIFDFKYRATFVKIDLQSFNCSLYFCCQIKCCLNQKILWKTSNFFAQQKRKQSTHLQNASFVRWIGPRTPLRNSFQVSNFWKKSGTSKAFFSSFAEKFRKSKNGLEFGLLVFVASALSSESRSFDRKVATFPAKSSQKVATFYRQNLLNKIRFLCKINTFWWDFFCLTWKFFKNFLRMQTFFKKYPHNSLKSTIFWQIFHNF